jgi:hypothetical protein
MLVSLPLAGARLSTDSSWRMGKNSHGDKLDKGWNLDMDDTLPSYIA